MDEKRVKKVIWMLIILSVIVVISIFIISNTKKNNSEAAEEEYNLNTVAGIIAYKKGKFIKQETSKDEAYHRDIYLEFGPDLYDPEDDMRKQFYTNMFVRLSKVLGYQNFRLIDEGKDITIGIKCDVNKKTIVEIMVNGDKNYWGNIQSQYNLLQLGNNEVNSKINIQANELTRLIQNEWRRVSLNLDDSFKTVGNYDVFSDKGIEIRTINRQIFNIVFTANYKDDVVNNIKTTTTFEDVINILGEPTVGSEESGIIGYRGEDIYIFFLSNNEISVYRIEKEYSNLNKFFELIKQWEKDRDIKEFVNRVTDIWPDWDVYNYNTTMVDLRYTLKGIKIQFGVSQNNGIIYDKNYTADLREGLTIEDVQKDITKLPQFTYFENNDYIYENEFNRYYGKVEIDSEDTYDEEIEE